MNAHDERISSFLDDAMPAAERGGFESELLDNAELRQQVIELRQLRQDVARLPRFSVTEGFAQRVVAAAIAAKANENANISPASQLKPKTVRRATIGTLAIAASVAIVLGTLAWINRNGPVDLANSNLPREEIKQAADNPLASVLASLPADDQVLVVRIKSSKNVAAGTLLREALAEQGIERRRPSDQTTGGGLVRKAYKDHLVSATGNDPNKSKPAADALYLQISPEELELALSRLAQPEQKVKFVAEQQLAIAGPKGSTNIIGENTAAAEDVPGNNPNPTKTAPKSDDFVQELTPSLFRLPAGDADSAVAPAVMPAPAATPKGKVRVLILIENVE